MSEYELLGLGAAALILWIVAGIIYIAIHAKDRPGWAALLYLLVSAGAFVLFAGGGVLAGTSLGCLLALVVILGIPALAVYKLYQKVF